MSRSRTRILLVEDNAGDAWMIADCIANQTPLYQGGEIEVMTEGESALRRIEQLAQPSDDSGFDLLIADLNLPRYSGQAIIAAWRRSSHGALPVVVTSSGEAGKIEESSAAPVYYFQKPMDLVAYSQIALIVQTALACSQSIELPERQDNSLFRTA